MSLTKQGRLSRTLRKLAGKRQSEDQGGEAVGGIDQGAIPNSDFYKVQKFEEGEMTKARNYTERKQLEMFNKY